MHLHFISPLDPLKFRSSPIASERLRLSYVEEAAKQSGYKITGSISINGSPDVIYISKITEDMYESILQTIKSIKNTSTTVLVDYTDDILGSNFDDERIKIYEELIKINSVFVVPVEGLSKQLEKKGNSFFVIPDGIDKIPSIDPFNKHNKLINVLWNGHSSNINSLLRIISNDLVDFSYNLHIVSNASSFQILKEVKLNNVPKCKLIGHIWSINTLQKVSKNCDLAILPSDKRWASANRLVTNFRLGLPVIAETINSYEPYSDYYCSFSTEEVSDMFRSQEQWYELVRKAQKQTAEDFSDEKIINLWKKMFKNIYNKNI
tara:strand:+ start:46 stop:1005 length:960 start_codon:yes stop_codon:yes gene_type:complete